MPEFLKLFSLDEVFIYRVPPIKFAGGYRAEDWDLTEPLQTCSLSVEQLDIDVCLVKFHVDKITPDGFDVALFAQCNILVSSQKREGGLEQYLENVLDSSRYFVVKIEDLKTCRTANIGVGFRERKDAGNFRRVLLDFYEQSIRRQAEIFKKFGDERIEDESVQYGGKKEKVSIYADPGNKGRKLTLTDWEKIQLNDARSENEESLELSNDSDKHETASRGDSSNSTAEETVDDDLSCMNSIGRIDTSVDSRYEIIVPRKNKRLVPGLPSSKQFRQISTSATSATSAISCDEDDSEVNGNYLHEELVAREEQIQKLQSQFSGLQCNLQTTSGNLAKKEAETASLCLTLSKAIKYIEEYKTRVRDLEDTQTKLESELDTTKNLNSKLKTERYQLETNLGELIDGSGISTKKDVKKKKKKKGSKVGHTKKIPSLKKILPV